jgi:hypothetical protein
VVLHLVLGCVNLAFGAVMVGARRRIVARHELRGRRPGVPPAGWTVLGVMFGLAGAIQIALALV